MSENEEYFTELKDGKLAIRTLSQSGSIVPEEGKDPKKYVTALVQTDSGKQLCLKTLNLGGGGGGGTTDYTDLENKPQINSVTLTGNKTGSDLGLLENKATGTDSLALMRTTNANISYVFSQGYYSTQPGLGAISIGHLNNANGQNSIAIGRYAQTANSNSIAIGWGSYAYQGGIAIGSANITSETPYYTPSQSTTTRSNAYNAIQLGIGINNTANSFQVFTYQLLDGNTGKIPSDRMTKVIELTTTSVELASDNIYNGAELASVTFTLPATVPVNFTAQVNFTSGATATVLTAPNTINFEGDDCTGGAFTPVASKRYQVLIASDGVNVNGYVIGR